MNDRFRFRAWDEGTKIYFDNAMIETLAPISTWVKNGWVVEQCTGLKDKKGRLIYEGDIVKEKLFNTDIAVIKFGNGSGFQCFYPEWKGKYSKETKYNPGFRKDLYYWLKEKQEGMEVIGNIHENPELLEDK